MKLGKFIRVKYDPLKALLLLVMEQGTVEMRGWAELVNKSCAYDVECRELERRTSTIYHNVIDG